MKNYHLQISITISGVLIAASIAYGFSLKYGFNLYLLQHITSIIGSLSIFVALATYFYSKRKDKRNLVIEQVSFFRKEALLEGDKFVESIRREMGENYFFSRVRLDEPTIAYTKENHYKESKEQINLLKKMKTLSKQTQLLNILEEFALRVLYSDTYNCKALNILKSPFIELVEINAVVLLQQREFFTGKQSFLNTLRLYSLWKNHIDRRTPEERIKEFEAKFSNQHSSIKSQK